VELIPGVRRDPGADLDAVGQEDDLVARIHDEIERDGPITFARFMELALYDPTGGYYRASDARPGREGDFLTAPETHPIFGATIARGLDEIWDRLGRPDPFVLREFGSGTGTLALAILERLQLDGSGLARSLRYDPVEIESRRLETLAERFAALGCLEVLVDPRAAGEPIVGVILANEVLDALPTHRVAVRGGRLMEILVESAVGQLIDVEAGPTTPALAARLAAEGVTLAEGQRAEVCLAIDPWMAAAAGGLERGAVVLIDYGHPASELYDPARRPDGTLRAYVRQTVHDDPYRHVGRQDLTAHVDLTAVERAAAASGLVPLGTTTQAEFLVGFGIENLLRTIQADPATTLEEYLPVRSAIRRLLDPAVMGRFRVLGFGRDWPDGAGLSGFSYRLATR
jgi:SAM-dependent MidA family methyltransferase